MAATWLIKYLLLDNDVVKAEYTTDVVMQKQIIGTYKITIEKI